MHGSAAALQPHITPTSQYFLATFAIDVFVHAVRKLGVGFLFCMVAGDEGRDQFYNKSPLPCKNIYIIYEGFYNPILHIVVNKI